MWRPQLLHRMVNGENLGHWHPSATKSTISVLTNSRSLPHGHNLQYRGCLAYSFPLASSPKISRLHLINVLFKRMIYATFPRPDRIWRTPTLSCTQHLDSPSSHRADDVPIECSIGLSSSIFRRVRTRRCDIVHVPMNEIHSNYFFDLDSFDVCCISTVLPPAQEYQSVQQVYLLPTVSIPMPCGQRTGYSCVEAKTSIPP